MKGGRVEKCGQFQKIGQNLLKEYLFHHDEQEEAEGHKVEGKEKEETIAKA